MNNPPAFPGKQKALLIKSEHSDIAKEYEIDQNGMTLRDYFAAKAMQGLLSDPDWRQDMDFEETAYAAYKQADAMLKTGEV